MKEVQNLSRIFLTKVAGIFDLFDLQLSRIFTAARLFVNFLDVKYALESTIQRERCPSIGCLISRPKVIILAGLFNQNRAESATTCSTNWYWYGS